MLTHTRSGEKKQKKKKAPLAFGTRSCALQSQDFQVIIVTLSHGRYGNVCITRNYQHGSSLVRMRPNLPVLFARDVVAEKRYKAWQSGLSYVEWSAVGPLLVLSGPFISSYVSTMLSGSENGGNIGPCLTMDCFSAGKKIVWWFAQVSWCCDQLRSLVDLTGSSHSDP